MDPGWVHYNCAMWSSGVVRDDDGRIFGAENILGHIKRFKQTTICSICQAPGATIACVGSKYCHNVFHFLCAKKAGMRCLCEEHLGKSSRQLELEIEYQEAQAEAKRVKALLATQAQTAKVEAMAQKLAEGKGIRLTRRATLKVAAD